MTIEQFHDTHLGDQVVVSNAEMPMYGYVGTVIAKYSNVAKNIYKMRVAFYVRIEGVTQSGSIEYDTGALTCLPGHRTIKEMSRANGRIYEEVPIVFFDVDVRDNTPTLGYCGTEVKKNWLQKAWSDVKNKIWRIVHIRKVW